MTIARPSIGQAIAVALGPLLQLFPLLVLLRAAETDSYLLSISMSQKQSNIKLRIAKPREKSKKL